VAGAYGLSQRYLLPTLRLAHAASNILIVASGLDTMSHLPGTLR